MNEDVSRKTSRIASTLKEQQLLAWEQKRNQSAD
uniref:Uncharacterized protein n=1 Tax=Manihot esculenta TaxID=3983 RepID=A0A2C9UDM7_MANES